MLKKITLLFSLAVSTTFGAVEQRAALCSFAKLAKKCDASLRSSSDRGAIKAFLAIRKIYENNKLPFRLLEKLNDEEVAKLYDNCMETMQEGMPTRRPVIVSVTQTTEQREALEEEPVSGEELMQAVEGFTAAYNKHLLKETTLKRFFTRLGLQTIIETAAMGVEHLIDPVTRKKHVPKVSERATALTNISGSKLAGNIGVSLTRVGAHCIVDEYLPKGTNSYWKRCVELVAPVILAGIILTLMDKGNMKHLNKAFMGKALNRFVLTRCQLPKNHGLYPVANAAAYVGPFTLFSKSARQAFKEGKTLELNSLGNMVIDGLAAMVLYDLIPRGVDKAVPRKVAALNPAHRRKAIKNVPRNILDRVFKAVTDAAFEATN